jgi:dihydrolipoamide dehydrogenase
VPGFDYDDDPVLSSQGALALDEVPESLVVVGAGYIGMELATVYAKLGADVTVVEMLDEILPGFEADLTRPVKKRAKELGITLNVGEAAQSWQFQGDLIEVKTATENDQEQTYTAEKVLVAVGREPVTGTVKLDSIGLEVNDQGFLDTDEQCRTAIDHVFAVGDVAGEPMLAHKASREGEVVAEVIAGVSTGIDSMDVPAAVFTDPEIGTVGLCADEAADRGYDPVVGEFPFRASGRALTIGETEGFVRIVADKDSGTILGGQIVGPDASEIIAEIGLAVKLEAGLEDLATMVHAHPTLSEAVMEAAKSALGQAIHTLNR